MHRNNLLELLHSYDPQFEKEREDKAKMLEFLRNNPDCFERSLASGHFTGSAWISNYDHTAFLLTHHKKLNMWLQLGGHADGESNLIDVALREAYEESGLKKIDLLSSEIFDIGVHEIPEYKGVSKHFHFDVRFLLVSGDPSNEISISHESNDLKWFSAPPSDNEDVHRMFEKWERFVSKNIGIS